MKCYCYETEKEFIFCVEDAKGKFYETLRADRFWKKTEDDKFIKVYPTDTGWDDAWYLDSGYKEAVKNNFARMGRSWIEGVFDWEKVLLFLAQKFMEHSVEWYIIGSVSEAVLGVEIEPHDIDICVHTRDFYKVKDLFRDYVIEPLGDNKGNWLVRYFGKLCVDGSSIDIAADDKMNMENIISPLSKVYWNGYALFIEPLQNRYKVETQRGRNDRIKAIEKYMNCQKHI